MFDTKIFNMSENNSIGLGELVHKVAKATKIEALVHSVVGEEDCGCEQRREKWNKVQIPLPKNPFSNDK